MTKIIVKHTRIEIHDYVLGESKLDRIFSLYNKVTHSYYLKGIIYDEEKKILYIPRGVDINYVSSLFGGIKPEIDFKHDEYDKTSQTYIKFLPRDEVQKESLRFMIGEGDYKFTKNNSQLSVNLNTGKGKTYCSIATIAYLNIRSAIITSSINWLNQWKQCILDYTDVTEKEIYTISGSASIFTLLKRGVDKYKYILISHATVRSYGEKHGWDKVTELFKFLRIGIKIYDESHLDFDNICKIDYHTNTFKTYYVTATPMRSQKEEDFIYQLFLKNVPAISLYDEDKDPRTNYTAIRYNSNPTPQEISNCKNQYGLDRNKYTNQIVYNENFYKLLHIIMSIILKNGGKSLIYIGTNNAINIVYEWLITNYPEMSNSVGIYTSTVTVNKKEQLDKQIILSTTKSCGPAVDIKGLTNTIVLAEPFKSDVIAIQTFGRTRAENTNYIEVVDMGFAQIQKYYVHKKPVFSKHALSCTEVVLKQVDLDFKYTQIMEYRASLIVRVPLFQKIEKHRLFNKL